MAQAFDLRRLELTGEAVPIAEGIGSGGPTPFLGLDDWRSGLSGKGSHGRRSDHATYLVRSGQGNRSEPSESRARTTPWLSRPMEPASRSAASTAGSVGTRRRAFDIWVYEFARDTSERLTSDPASDWFRRVVAGREPHHLFIRTRRSCLQPVSEGLERGGQ